MTTTVPKAKRTRSIHTFFLAVGVLVAWWGFASIDDSIKHPFATGASWQVGGLIVLFGGMITGVAVSHIISDILIPKKSKHS